MRIWVIEDNRELRSLYHEAIRHLHHRIVLCGHVSQIEAGPDDVIVLDIHGTESETLQNLNHALVIRISGDRSVAADFYKPFQPDLLCRKILSWMSERDQEAA
jgi:DNA-binding response OmpR family regulator